MRKQGSQSAVAGGCASERTSDLGECAVSTKSDLMIQTLDLPDSSSDGYGRQETCVVRKVKPLRLALEAARRWQIGLGSSLPMSAEYPECLIEAERRIFDGGGVAQGMEWRSVFGRA